MYSNSYLGVLNNNILFIGEMIGEWAHDKNGRKRRYTQADRASK